MQIDKGESSGHTDFRISADIELRALREANEKK
jgi:hypothetical protein